MKRTLTTLAIILSISLAGMAQQQGGGLFGRGAVLEEAYNDYNYRDGSGLILPSGHGGDTDQNGTPIGSGLLLLAGMGAAYLISKKKKD